MRLGASQLIFTVYDVAIARRLREANAVTCSLFLLYKFGIFWIILWLYKDLSKKEEQSLTETQTLSPGGQQRHESDSEAELTTKLERLLPKENSVIVVDKPLRLSRSVPSHLRLPSSAKVMQKRMATTPAADIRSSSTTANSPTSFDHRVSWRNCRTPHL